MTKEHAEYEVVVEKPARLGEGAIWDSGRSVLFWVSILDQELYAYDPSTGNNRTIPTCQAVGTVVPHAGAGVIVALHNGFATLDLESEKIVPIADPERDIPSNRFNDGKCDPAGRLWAGTMAFDATPDAGALYCLDTNRSIIEKIAPVTISNGIVWNSRCDTMYYIDTATNNVRAYDYDLDSGAIANERIVVINNEGGGFDGMAIDSEDNLWIAVFHGGGVRCYNPESGLMIRELSLPVTNVTSCAFGGNDLDELYVTCAREGLSENDLAKQPLAGSLFRLKPGVQGTLSYSYAG